MSSFFHTIISIPLYNGFIGLMKLLPFLDAGMIVILFTIVIKTILLPLSIKASRAQLEMKQTEKAIALIKEQYPNREEQGVKMMQYYKDHGINPFAGILILIIQLPILIGLYGVFIKSGLPTINVDWLYSFIPSPSSVNMVFLGLLDISGKSIVLALLAGLTTYFQVSIAAGGTQSSGGAQNDMARVMAMQMKYFLPVLITFIGYTVSSGVALYLMTSNIFAIIQEMYIKKKYHKTVFVE